MRPLQAIDIANATGGTLVAGDGSATIECVCTDSRAMKSDSLFIAIVGETFDPHDKLAAAVAGGAKVLLVQRWPLEGAGEAAVVLVDHTRAALGRLANHVRRQFDPALTVIAVAGSNGKTGTKHLIHSVLSTELVGTMSPKSFNNDIGVPITLFGADEDDDFVVVEIGTNHPGEVEHLSRMCEPDVAVITSIGEEHMEFFGTLDGVRHENAAVVAGLRDGGRVLICGDDAGLRVLIPGAETFGFSEDNNLRAEDVRAGLEGVSFAVAANKTSQSTRRRHATANPPPLEGGGRGRGSSVNQRDRNKKFPFAQQAARQLRTEMTFPERLLWSKLRGKQAGGHRFRRQQSIGRHVADFYCAAARLVIEVDGRSHDFTSDADAARERWLQDHGLRVIRFSNDDVLNHLEGVVLEIERNLATAPPTLPSPLGGEGFARGSIDASTTFFVVLLPGRHNASNALAAIAVARGLGLDDESICRGLAGASAPEMRMQKRTIAGITVLNDAYNANPSSMRAALQTVEEVDWPGRKIVVLGEMRELGEHSARAHQDMVLTIASAAFDQVFLVGPAFAFHRGAGILPASESNPSTAGETPAPRDMATALPHAHPTIDLYPDVPAAAAAVAAFVRPGDLVLLKASRGVRLERVEAAIAAAYAERSA